MHPSRCLLLGPLTSAARIRAAYWSIEFECHPDRYRDASPETQADMADHLTQARQATDTLHGFAGLSWGLWGDFEAFRGGEFGGGTGGSEGTQ